MHWNFAEVCHNISSCSGRIGEFVLNAGLGLTPPNYCSFWVPWRVFETTSHLNHSRMTGISVDYSRYSADLNPCDFMYGGIWKTTFTLRILKHQNSLNHSSVRHMRPFEWRVLNIWVELYQMVESCYCWKRCSYVNQSYGISPWHTLLIHICIYYFHTLLKRYYFVI